jgi:hypothetical protein
VLLVPAASVLLFRSQDAAVTDAHMQGHAQFLLAKSQLVQRLAADDSPEEVVIVTRDRLHLFRALPARPTVYLALSLDRAQTQLGVARLRLQEIEQALALL